MQILQNKLHHPEAVQLRIDEHIPLNIVFGNDLSGQIFLRYVSSDSLLEIGFCPIDGRLNSIKIIQSNALIRAETLSELLVVKPVDGLVCCNPDSWAGKMLLDRQSNFDFFVGDSAICLKLNDGEIFKIVKNKGVYFGCSDQDLLWILVLGLNNSDTSKIEQIVSEQQEHGFL